MMTDSYKQHSRCSRTYWRLQQSCVERFRGRQLHSWHSPALVEVASPICLISLPFSVAVTLQVPGWAKHPRRLICPIYSRRCYYGYVNTGIPYCTNLHWLPALVLPGSANAIGIAMQLYNTYPSNACSGGQGFVIKTRKTSERTVASLLLEPPFSINGTVPTDGNLRWRYLKQVN
jgi:hypothetical protein